MQMKEIQIDWKIKQRLMCKQMLLQGKEANFRRRKTILFIFFYNLIIYYYFIITRVIES